MIVTIIIFEGIKIKQYTVVQQLVIMMILLLPRPVSKFENCTKFEITRFILKVISQYHTYYNYTYVYYL